MPDSLKDLRAMTPDDTQIAMRGGGETVQGFIATLTPEQRAQALAYEGDDTQGAAADAPL